MGKQKHKNLKYLIPILVVEVLFVAVTLGASADFLGMAAVSGNTDAPDLVVTYAGIDDSGYITAEITNLGKADVPSDALGHTYIYVGDPDDPDKKYTYSWEWLSDKTFMLKGESSKIIPAKYSALNLTVAEEDAVITVCVDPNNVVDELNEENNCRDSKVDEDPVADDPAKDPVDDPAKDPVDDPANDDQKDLDLYPQKAGFGGDHQEIFVVEVCTNYVPSSANGEMGVDLIIVNSETKSEIFKNTYTVTGLSNNSLCTKLEVPTKEFDEKFEYRTLHYAVINVDPENRVSEVDEKNNKGSFIFRPIILTPFNINDICEDRSLLDPPRDVADVPELQTYTEQR